METAPATYQRKITPEVLAELRRARLARIRWLLAIVAAACLILGYGAWQAARHFIAASWLEANGHNVAWDWDGDGWSKGGATSIQARAPGYLTPEVPDVVDLSMVTMLHRVVELDLAQSNGLRDSDLEILGKLPELRILNLDQTSPHYRPRPGENGLTDATVARIGGLRHLRNLALGGSRITDAGLTQLSRLPELDTLDLGRTGITDAGLESLRGMKGLRSLVLLNTRVTPGAIQAFEVARPDVRVLSDANGPDSDR